MSNSDVLFIYFKKELKLFCVFARAQRIFFLLNNIEVVKHYNCEAI